VEFGQKSRVFSRNHEKSLLISLLWRNLASAMGFSSYRKGEVEGREDDAETGNGHRVIGSSGHRVIGSSGHRVIGSSGHREK
jgi:hypothetical protein